MNNKYKKTMDKVSTDDAFKRELKKTLNAPKKKYNPLLLRYASIVLMIAVGMLVYSTNKPVSPPADTNYVITLDHDYYNSIEAYTKPLQDYEKYSLDFKHLHQDNIIIIEDVTSYINDNTVYSTLKGTSITSDESKTFELYGGTIAKEEWDKVFEYELDDYNNESYITVVNDRNLQLNVGELYYVEKNEPYEDTVYKVRQKDSHYEVYIELINEWILVQ